LGMGPYGIPAHRSSFPAVWCLACGFLRLEDSATRVT
jgi:hypothetical protein